MIKSYTFFMVVDIKPVNKIWDASIEMGSFTVKLDIRNFVFFSLNLFFFCQSFP